MTSQSLETDPFKDELPGADSPDAGARPDADEFGPLIELELNDLAYGGDAVGRYQGRAVFVPGGLPGELVTARLTRERSNYARATLVEVLRASPDRVPPRYPDLTESGGFQWQHLAYFAQLSWKTRIVRQLLTRVGRFTNPPVRNTIGMPPGADPWRYRTVAQFAIGDDGAIGFRRAGSHDVLDMPDCPIVHPALDTLYQNVRAWIRANWGEAASDYAERFTLRVAVAAPEPDAVDTTRYTPPPGHEPPQPAGLLAIEARPGSAIDAGGGPHALGEAILAAVPDLVGVVILGLPGGRGRVVIGQDFVYEHVHDRTFRISAGSFFQVNAAQTPVLVEQALAALRPRPTDWALDGYSGVGLFSMFLADHVTHVHAIESQPSAVTDARASAALNNVANVTVTEGVLERVLGTLRRQNERVDIALVDPPRAGCHPRALSEIAQLAPRSLVYVSCDPSTLARDLQIICNSGYRLTSVQPVDMFPFTSHIECVAVCDRLR
ncbi:MAG: RNA methyltransferase, TrmA family [Ktedonobacterales bacterium]|jgi:23S rRNA (uracil1939-C5)-methyltransferase|nr:MAG: RNA methyltransferase, TrmA family [Ktedonobacterales bacterium]